MEAKVKDKKINCLEAIKGAALKYFFLIKLLTNIPETATTTTKKQFRN